MSKKITEQLRAICLALPEATEKEAWGDPTFRVRDKIFAMEKRGDGRVSVWLKAPAGFQEVIVATDPESCFVPPYVGHKGWIGIRPEKVLIGDPGEELDAPGSSIPGGVVSDVSFVGVSTQYLVRMPWGQELQVFQQNTGHRRLYRTGEPVELSWRPEYAFLLDSSQDASAGAEQAD